MLILSQKSYLEKVLQRFSIDNAKPVSVPLAAHFRFSASQCPSTNEQKKDMELVPYASAIGSLMYTMVCSRPNLAQAVSVLSRFMSNPGRDHWSGVKWLLRYVKGSLEVGLKFTAGSNKVGITGFVDSDFAGDLDKRRSSTGYLFMLCGGPISWKSHLRSIVALSSTEAEYIAATEAMKETIWLRGLLNEPEVLEGEVVLYCDNQGAIQLCKNSVYHERTKHVDVRFHFIREVVSSGMVKLEKVHTDDNPADMATKVVPLHKFRHCLNLLQMT